VSVNGFIAEFEWTFEGLEKNGLLDAAATGGGEEAAADGAGRWIERKSLMQFAPSYPPAGGSTNDMTSVTRDEQIRRVAVNRSRDRSHLTPSAHLTEYAASISDDGRL
jgi:hypothetical protein